MLYFDHSYTNDPGHRFLKQLEKLGFLLDEREVEHEGRQFCRFIMFPSARHQRGMTYLEFVNVKRGGKPIVKPGLSFGYRSKLERFHQRLVREGKYRSKFEHRNYDWKMDSSSRLPGWNFLMFKGLGLRGLFPWITEYEPNPNRKPYKPRRHPNGALSTRGFEFEVNAKGEAFLSYLLGKALKSVTRLPCGTEFYITRAKRTKLKAVILNCQSVPRLLRRKGVEQAEFRGQRAARIRNPSGMWDIVLTDC